MLLWDVWVPDEEEPDREALDGAAALTRRGDDVFSGLRHVYEKHPNLKTPTVVKSYSPAFGPREVRLAV